MRDHRSLHAWQEARSVFIGVIKQAQHGWKPWGSALFSQLQRASLSVQLNIAEGYAYGDSPSFRKHLSIAYGSAVETGELLELALEVEVVSQELGTVLLRRNQRSQRLLLGMIRRRIAEYQHSQLTLLCSAVPAHRLRFSRFPLTQLVFPAHCLHLLDQFPPTA